MQSQDKTPGNLSLKTKEELMFAHLVIKQTISFRNLSDIIKEWHAFDAALQPHNQGICMGTFIMPCAHR